MLREAVRRAIDAIDDLYLCVADLDGRAKRDVVERGDARTYRARQSRAKPRIRRFVVGVA